jgi:hypothetical protein
MSYSLAATQSASIIVTTVDTTIVSGAFANFSLPAAALFRFALTPGTYFTYPCTFTATLATSGGDEEFYILVTNDGDGISTLTNGALDASLVPSEYSSVHGTADSIELARETVSAAGEVEFELDLEILTRFMATSTRYDSPFNGSLTLWLCSSDDALGLWTGGTLNAYSRVDYTNRDTGGKGIQSSRYTRCPISGLLIPKGEMILDGYRGIHVHPEFWDPEEPEPREWGDEHPDANEDT